MECVQDVGAMYERYCARIWEELNEQGEPLEEEEDRGYAWYPAIENLKDAYNKGLQMLAVINHAAEQTENTTACPRIDSIADALEKLNAEIMEQIERMEGTR